MRLDFAVVDVETANADFSSICAIGVAKFRNGVFLKERHYTLVNPDTYFTNTYIHGIAAEDVEDAPNLEEGLKLLDTWLSEDYERTVCHMAFDRNATSRVAKKVDLEWSHIKWHDSAYAVRLGWDEYRKSGYGLKIICKVLGIEFKHHNALEDARAAGLVLVEAAKRIDQSEVSLWEQIAMEGRIRSRSSWPKKTLEKPEANPEGDFYGQGICFTGILANMNRKEAWEKAASLGFELCQSVNEKCNILVVGELDERRFAEGAETTRKYSTAKERIEAGEEIEIISSLDFDALLKY